MNEVPTVLIAAAIIVSLFALFFGLVFLVRRQNRKATIAAIKQGQGVVSTWHYTPDEWKYASENYFQMKARRLLENGKVSFSDRYIYVSNGREDVLFELVGAQKYVKHLTEVYSYKDSPMNIIRFQVRTKTIKKGEGGHETMEEKYDLETFYVPVPKDYRLETEKVIKFYQDILDKNPDAVAAVMPYGLGLFGK